MEIHWLADACVAGGLLLAAKTFSFYWWHGSKAREPELRRSRLSVALEGSRTGAWIWEIDGRSFFCDTRACRNLGAAPGSILGLDDFLSCIPDPDRIRVELELQAAAAANKPFELTACVGTGKGGERHVALTGQPELDELGRPIRLSGTLRDVTAERRRNAALRRQSQILAQVHDAIIATTPGNRILSWNAAAERMYGYSAAEAVGRPMHMLWFDEDRETLNGGLSAASLVSDTHELVSRVRHKSGAELYAHCRLALMRDPDGAPIGLLICSHDVTLQREEHELLTLQASALENIGEAVLVTRKLGAIVHCNAAASDLFARGRGKLLGLSFADLLSGDPARASSRMLAIQEAVAAEGKWSGELLCGGAAGGAAITAWTGVRSLDLASGPAWVWVLQDITEQRRAEAALLERERRFRELADSAPMMVWMTNARGECEYVNQAWLGQASISCEQAQGFGWQRAINPADRAELSRLLDCQAGPCEPFEMELRMSREDGPLRYVLSRGAPRSEAGKIAGFIGSAIDITNIKRAEQERIEFEQQALKSQKMHSLGVLAGGIAHDFNNMLVSVLGFSDLALRELEPRHPARELVEQIELGSRRAAALVDQVLTFAGKARKANEEVGINEAVREMISLLERAIGPRVSFDLDLDGDLPAFIGDPAQVRQVIMNLVLNASDALGDGGGRIQIRTAVRDTVPGAAQHWVGGDSIAPGPYVALEVQDGGSGMDKETLSQIFDPFFTTKFTGRGLGLSAVMGVVRSHAGAIRVDSEPGGGSSFCVLFPLSHDLAPDPAERRRGAFGEVCALIVDDDPTVLLATRQMLQSGGVRVFCAQTAAEAIQTLESNRHAVQLVLLDVVMPNANPRDLAAALRETKPDIQILLTSGFSDSSLRPPIDGRTVVGFLPKPYNRNQLLEAVSRVCPAAVSNAAEDSATA